MSSEDRPSYGPEIKNESTKHPQRTAHERPMHVQFFMIYSIFSFVLLMPNIYKWVMHNTYYPVSMILICTVFPIGVANLIIKGKEPGPEVPKRDRGKYYMRMASRSTKFFWVLFGLFGFGIGMWLFLMDAVFAT